MGKAQQVLRAESMQEINTKELANAFIDEKVKEIQEQVGDRKVLLALSGGVDSSVLAAALKVFIALTIPLDNTILTASTVLSSTTENSFASSPSKPFST